MNYPQHPDLPSFRDEVAKIPKERYNFVAHSMAIAAAIDDVMQARKMSQKDFAELMNEDEDTISHMLSGAYDFTIKTIAKIEAVLEVDILNINGCS